MGAPPPVGALLFMYFVVGSALSVFTGRRPGSLPENVMAEMAPSFVVLSLWVMSYSVLDVMGVGVVKMKYNLQSKLYKDYPTTEPEEVHLAGRAQMNQVEQMASYIVTTLMFSFVVNGRVGGLLSFIWFVLRELYAATYRKAAGKSLQDAGVVKFTVPCYFILNGMAASVVVHLCRFAMTTM
eukprot:Skav214853  [mRNA]  locus=scaffold16:265074:268650:+ [translate_table: standard]